MVLRIAIILAVLVNIVQACCLQITVGQAASEADIVFRGTVTEIHDANRDILTDILQPRKRIAVFRVNRVWKGNVGGTVEIPLPQSDIHPGWGSFATIGNELLVYARKDPKTSEYLTSICYRTTIAQKAVKDLQELGPGEPPVREHESISYQ